MSTELLVDHLIEGLLEVIAFGVLLEVVEAADTDDTGHVLVLLLNLLVEDHYHVVLVLRQLRVLELQLLAFSLCAHKLVSVERVDESEELLCVAHHHNDIAVEGEFEAEDLHGRLLQLIQGYDLPEGRAPQAPQAQGAVPRGRHIHIQGRVYIDG